MSTFCRTAHSSGNRRSSKAIAARQLFVLAAATTITDAMLRSNWRSASATRSLKPSSHLTEPAVTQAAGRLDDLFEAAGA